MKLVCDCGHEKIDHPNSRRCRIASCPCTLFCTCQAAAAAAPTGSHPRPHEWVDAPKSSDEPMDPSARMAANEGPPAPDPVDHPPHYTSHPSGVECIAITRHMTFNVGNAVKYLWRAGLKSDNTIEDLKKAAWYIRDEIKRLGGEL
jgi:hypothetical protein